MPNKSLNPRCFVAASGTLLALLVGCGGCGSEVPQQRVETSQPELAQPSAQGAATPTPSMLLPVERARPVVFRIVNDGSSATNVAVSFGVLEPFRLERDDGAAHLTLAMDSVVEGPSCTCRCGYPCLNCEPPQFRQVAVEPHGTYEVRWPGWVHYWRDGCHDPYALGPGTYRITACLSAGIFESGECLTQTLTLPQEVLEFRFGER